MKTNTSEKIGAERTKEIDCYVFEKDINNWEALSNKKFMDIYKDLRHGLKAKLIIELPERKRTFTESEIREELDYFDGRGYRTEEIERIMEKLFGESDEN